MKSIITFSFVFIFFPVVLVAQKKGGIAFIKGMNWQVLKEKAKRENKYIFVDCYATWCAPCKKMDLDIYSNDSIGEFINEKFIAVKVQVDTTTNDDDNIKLLYPLAHTLVREHSITSLPAFLFFSPDGEIVHKDIGSKTVSEFSLMAEDALNERYQYYSIVRRFKDRKLQDYEIASLAEQARSLGDDEFAYEVAKYYLHRYLDHLTISKFCSDKENFNFLASFYKILNTNEKAFTIYYKYPHRVDSIMGKGYAARYSNFIIFKSELSPVLDAAKEKGVNPKWKMLHKKLKSKYSNAIATDNIINAKVSWYKFKKDWKNYTRFIVKQVENKGINNYPSDLGGIMSLNGYAWTIFLHSKNKREMGIALTWANKALQMDSIPSPAVMDTKANLLYKLGRKTEAIELYKQIIKLAPSFDTTYQKMIKDLPTWELEE